MDQTRFLDSDEDTRARGFPTQPTSGGYQAQRPVIDEEYGEDLFQQRGQRRDRGASFLNCLQMTFLCCGALPWLHRKGATPLSYNTDESGHRNQHYKATAAWSAAAVFSAMIITLGVEGFKWAHDQEAGWYAGLDNVFHQVAAALTMGAIAAAIGGVAAGVHYGIDSYRLRGAVKPDPEQGSVALVETKGGSKHEFTEGSRLVNEEGRTVARMGGFDLNRLVNPPTPLKTFGWMTAVGFVGVGLTFAIKHEFFQDIADSSFGHYGAIATLALTTGGIFAGAMTGAHKIGALAHDKISPETESYQSLDF